MFSPVRRGQSHALWYHLKFCLPRDLPLLNCISCTKQKHFIFPIDCKLLERFKSVRKKKRLPHPADNTQHRDLTKDKLHPGEWWEGRTGCALPPKFRFHGYMFPASWDDAIFSGERLFQAQKCSSALEINFRPKISHPEISHRSS